MPLTRYFFLVSATIAVSTTPAIGQDTAISAAPADTASGQGGIDEIVVTAQRKQELLSRVPISVSAIGEEEIKEARVNSISDVATRAPSLSMTTDRKTNQNLFIRGVGSTEEAAGGDQSVGVFVDGVYIGRGGALPAGFYDVARIEVLRGPQGTLYGRNVAGGALNITTNSPGDQFGYEVEGTYGNYDLKELQGYMNVPVGTDAAFRLTASHSQHDGYVFNAFTGNDVYAEKSTSGRLQFSVAPADNFDILIKASVERVRDYGLPRNASPCGPSLCLPRYDNPDYGNIPLETDPRRVQNQVDGFFYRNAWGVSTTMNWETSIGTLTSITGFLDSHQWSVAASGAAPDILKFKSIATSDETVAQFSQEVRLQSELTQDLTFNLGGFFYSEDIQRNDSTDRCLTSRITNPCTPTNILYAQDVLSRSVAAYSELTWQATDALKFIAGARYTYDWKDATLAAINLRDEPISPTGSRQPYGPFDVSKSWDAITPRAVVQYDLGRLGMVYATVSRGYKAGGYQGEAGNGQSIVVPFDPEYVTNYELGAKLAFFDRRLLTNLTGFIQKYDDQQVPQRFELVPGDPNSIVNVTANAAKSTIKGIEADLTARPVRFLDLWASLAYLDAKYDSFVGEDGDDFSGNRMRRSPKWAYSVGGKVTVPVGAGQVELRGDYKFKGKYAYGIEGNFIRIENGFNNGIPQVDPVPARELVDASLRYVPDNGIWEVSLWGKNLTNELYRTSAISVGDFVNSAFGPPRTYGVTLRFTH